MRSHQEGKTSPVLIGTIIGAIVFVTAASYYYYLYARGSQVPPSPQTVTGVVVTKMPEKPPSTGTANTNFLGKILAGKSAPLIDFNKTDYDAALKTNKLILLYFYANWCPICKEELPKMEAAFNELSTDKVIGFRANYNDSDTDESEKVLAREFGVAYQHTKVLLKNGQRVLKSPETWDKTRYLSEINKILK